MRLVSVRFGSPGAIQVSDQTIAKKGSGELRGLTLLRRAEADFNRYSVLRDDEREAPAAARIAS
jgi:hypothetical protein